MSTLTGRIDPGHLKYRPNVSSKFHHELRLALSDQIRDDLAFGLSNVHQILLLPAIFIDRFDHTLWRAPDLLYGWMAVYEMQ